MVEADPHPKSSALIVRHRVTPKINIGKLTLPMPPGKLITQQVQDNAFQLLRTEISHLDAYARLPLHHRDPFDRMIIAQANVEGLHIVGQDRAFDEYGVEMLW